MLGLSDKEIRNMITHYQATKQLKKYKVKMNAFAIMMKQFPGEYSVKKDKPFFDKYRDKEVYAYCYNGDMLNPKENDDWFILEDDNYCLRKSCFEEC